MAKPMTAADRLEAARAGLEATNKHLAELASRCDDALRRDDHRTASKLLGEIEEQRRFAVGYQDQIRLIEADAGIEGNGVRTIILETASRFARDLMVQEVGHAKLRERGIDLIAADNPGSFIDATPTAKLVRQVLGAISEFDKAMTVAKLRGARERKRRDVGKCEGRKSHAERNPELVALVRQLRRKRPKGGQRSLRDVSAELSQRGIMNERGQPFSAASINSMLNARLPQPR